MLENLDRKRFLEEEEKEEGEIQKEVKRNETVEDEVSLICEF